MTQPAGNTDNVVHALTAAYWQIRRHADEYRDTTVFRKAHERWQANRDDQRLYTKAAIHEFYAKGIEAAAREIADMLGIPEHEIEPITQEDTPA